MAKNAKCKHCLKDVLPTDTTKKVGAKSYHMKCYKEMIAQKYAVDDIELKDKRELYVYVNKLYKTKELDPKIMAQIDKYHNEYELSYKRIYLTMKYYYEIMEGEVIEGYGIGIVPYVYKEAGIFWESSSFANTKNATIDTSSLITHKKIIMPKEQSKPIGMIDIDSL